MTVVGTLIENTVFKDALVEIEALGFRVSAKPSPDSIPYGIIGGRSNQRWWLVPLNDRRLTISGLALFQPIVTSAKVLKGAAVMASNLGLSSAWARKKVYISGTPFLEDIFGEEGLCYAFFTGTDSPHRKVAVQIMDRAGRIKGFAKVSKNAVVKPLLNHEAKTLNYLQTLDLQTALVPKVLFNGVVGGVEALVTDSLKTARTKTVTTLNEAHLAFLRELAEKTAGQVAGSNKGCLRKRYDAVAERLPVEWQQRLEKALGVIEGSGVGLGAQRLSHGDFTPWNTFFVDGRLYVFDWEYASERYQVGHDLVHFALSLPAVKRQAAKDTIGQVRTVLRNSKVAADDKSADIFFLWYLCGHSLHYIAREFERSGKFMSWDGALEAGTCFDSLFIDTPVSA